MEYKLTPDKIKRMSHMALLFRMLEKGETYDMNWEGTDDEHLSPLFTAMWDELVEKEEGSTRIILTQTGREKLHELYEKYADLLMMHDCFSAFDDEADMAETSEKDNGDAFSDIEVKPFAHNYFFQFEDVDEWKNWAQNATTTYVDEEDGQEKTKKRFTNILLPIMQLKEVDPVEVIFLQFLKEGRFFVDRIDEETGERTPWQMDLVTAEFAQEMIEILDSMPNWWDISETKEDIEELMAYGIKLMFTLNKRAEEEEKVGFTEAYSEYEEGDNEDDDDEDDDELDNLDRTELIEFIVDNELDISVNGLMDDEDIRDSIRDYLSEEEEEDEFDEYEIVTVERRSYSTYNDYWVTPLYISPVWSNRLWW